MTKGVKTFRASDNTVRQIEQLSRKYNASEGEIITIAIDRMFNAEPKMYEQFEIVIKSDDEGFLGSDPDAISTIDQDKSYEAYCQRVRAEIETRYPGAKVEMPYGPYAGWSIRVFASSEHWNEIDDAQGNVEEICGRVYERGSFWVEKQ